MNEISKLPKCPELLSPAGSVEMMRRVIASGADAVYIGGSRFGARAYADNPEEDALLSAIDEAHLHGVRVHLTVNTLFKESEIAELKSYLAPYYECGVDAVLVQDIGVLKCIREWYPDLPIHASTQMSVTGIHGIRLLEKLGVSRVVLARELSLAEIRNIREETAMELEVFAHGALCVCYSGRCLMSSLLGGRSGNRGRCAQPCRLPYGYCGNGTSGRALAPATILSPKDLCALPVLQDLLEVGVDSLKIEGRMKQPVYAAGVTAIYRKYLDQYCAYGKIQVKAEDISLLSGLFSREGFTDGYLTGKKKGMMAVSGKPTRIDEKRMEEAKQRFLKDIPQLPLSMQAELNSGSAAKLTVKMVSKSGTCAETVVEGERVAEAVSKPITKEDVQKQLTKLGGTGFVAETVNVTLSENAFLPVSALNRLRREAIAALEETVLKEYRRKPFSSEAAINEVLEKGENICEDALSIEAVVTSREQLTAVLRAPDCGSIFAEWPLLAEEGAAWFVEACRTAGKIPGAVLPQIVRGPLSSLKEYAKAGIERFLARDLEGVAVLLSENLGEKTAADSSLYTMNHAAKEQLRALGIPSDTVPLELNRKELAGRDNAGSAMVIYGHLPMMVSAQCAAYAAGKCTHTPGFSAIRDRTGALLPVQRVCGTPCYTVIYNTVPLVLLKEAEDVRRLGIRAIRLCFTVEDETMTKRVLQSASAAYLRGETGTYPVKAFTKGHFARGVE